MQFWYIGSKKCIIMTQNNTFYSTEHTDTAIESL